MKNEYPIRTQICKDCTFECKVITTPKLDMMTETYYACPKCKSMNVIIEGYRDQTVGEQYVGRCNKWKNWKNEFRRW